MYLDESFFNELQNRFHAGGDFASAYVIAHEVGQFVLLMCHAWLGGKGASLPNNPVLLAKYARCERVSEAVMREWKAGPDGRLFNETLSEEWDAAISRSAHGAKAASARK